MTHKKTDWIETYTGKQFYPLEPDIDLIDIEDIAHALSNICRFTGHCEEFYSVAQHSVIVCAHCTPENALAGLLHDAAEAYICDIAKPIKPFITNYKQMEEKLLRVIFEKFQVPYPYPDEIKKIDLRLAYTEGKQLGFHTETWRPLVEPIHWNIFPWHPPAAKRSFLWAFHDLTCRKIKVA